MHVSLYSFVSQMDTLVRYDAEPNCSMQHVVYVVSMLNFDWRFCAHFVC